LSAGNQAGSCNSKVVPDEWQRPMDGNYPTFECMQVQQLSQLSQKAHSSNSTGFE
jgi:hypothetical protein